MRESMGPAVLDEPVREAPPTRRPRAVAALGDTLEARGTKRRSPPGRWHSSLCASDLQCLLQVIESELIPRLLNGYSPARDSPQDLRASP